MSDRYFDTHYQTCYLRSTGDYWHNPDEVDKFLANVDNSKQIMLHFDYQGFSMESSGLLDMIKRHAKTKPFLEPNQMLVIHSPNMSEDHYGYYNCFDMPVCDEFLRCNNYWIDIVPTAASDAKRFAHMVGRPTVPRIKLFWDMRKLDIQQYFFQSQLQDAGPGIWHFPEYHYDQLDQWFINAEEAENFNNWYRDAGITSFDDKCLGDQANYDKKVRLSAVNQCKKYHIDIVFESLTVGNTFAPTEKLIRSLITKKPFIVFAAPAYLQRLRDIGFRTFDPLWSELYDEYQLKQRYDFMLDEIIKLAHLSDDEFLHIIKQCQPIVEHNRNLLRQLNIDYYKSEQQWINKVEQVS